MTGRQHGIVVGVGAGTGGSTALDVAAGEARRRGVPVTPVHAWDLHPVQDAALVQSLDAAGAAGAGLLRQAVHRLSERAPGLVSAGTLAEGPAGPALVEAARHAELLVLGCRAGSGARLGAVLSHVSVHAACPVVAVPARETPEEPRPGRVLVGVDGSEVSAQAVAFAMTQASRWGVELVAVLAAPLRDDHLFGPQTPEQVPEQLRERGRRFLTESLAGCREQHPDVAVRTVVSLDDPQHALRAAARGAGLLVVGSHGRGALARVLLGSVSSGLLRNAPCPIAVVRPQGSSDGAHSRPAMTAAGTS